MKRKKVLLHGTLDSLKKFFSDSVSRDFEIVAILSESFEKISVTRNGKELETITSQNLTKFMLEIIDGIIITDDGDAKNAVVEFFLKSGVNPQKIILWDADKGWLKFNFQTPDGKQLVFLCGLEFQMRDDADKKFLDTIYRYLQNQREVKNWSPQKYPEVLAEQYQKRTGKPLDFKNPKTFTEKLQWLKIYDATPAKSLLADKYFARRWIAEKIGDQYLIPLLGTWENADDINFGELPNQFVLKCNHGWNMNIIVRDKKSLDVREARDKLNAWLTVDFGAQPLLELHYSRINRKIIAEKFMSDGVNPQPTDYKFATLNGKPYYCLTMTGRSTDLRIDYFDMNWQHMPFEHKNLPNSDHPEKILKPKNFELMKELAAKLAEGFAFVRVDFYEIDGKVYAGEMTFTLAAGNLSYKSEGTDEYLGSLLKLPKVSPASQSSLKAAAPIQKPKGKAKVSKTARTTAKPAAPVQAPKPEVKSPQPAKPTEKPAAPVQAPKVEAKSPQPAKPTAPVQAPKVEVKSPQPAKPTEKPAAPVQAPKVEAKSPQPAKPTEKPAAPVQAPKVEAKSPQPAKPTEKPAAPAQAPKVEVKSPQPAKPTEKPAPPVQTPKVEVKSPQPAKPTEKPAAPAQAPKVEVKSPQPAKPTAPVQAPKVEVKSPQPAKPTEKPAAPVQAPKVEVKSPQPAKPTEKPAAPAQAPKVEVKSPQPAKPTEKPAPPVQTPKVEVKSPQPAKPTAPVQPPKVEAKSPQPAKSDGPRIIASLTSWTKKISTADLAIRTILNQTRKPDLTVLYLATEEFPDHEKDLPPELLELCSERFEIRWTKNIGSYKKLIPALKDFPDDIIITFDDDLFYHPELIERLLVGYKKYPKMIHCHRSTTVLVDDAGEVTFSATPFNRPSYCHKFTGLSGVLYPPHSLSKEIFDEEKFMALAPTNDDVWFWTIALLNNRRVNIVEKNIDMLNYIPGTQEFALWRENDGPKNLTLSYVKSVLKAYPALKEILRHEQRLIGKN